MPLKVGLKEQTYMLFQNIIAFRHLFSWKDQGQKQAPKNAGFAASRELMQQGHNGADLRRAWI